MKFCYFGKDGGPDSTVWGFWPIEIKSLFSVALLCFENGSREAYHSHAFNSVSWVLSGGLEEDVLVQWKSLAVGDLEAGYTLHHVPSLKPVVTKRDTLHKVSSVGRSWVLTFRGPWANQWKEWLPKTSRFITFTHGRKEIE